MTSEFSNRLKDAKEIVNSDRVKKYIINDNIYRWVVVGNTREYLVMIDPYWCRCYDFQHSSLNDHTPKCKHNLAVKIALQKDHYDIVHLSKEEYDFVRRDFLIS
ncbi:MAG: hypothetical protein JSV04_02250 [Candidatus Heimdallarchaeota archaeon]|nr:MAG: hypothetical protein JSV04_02250 [Candidatus Heimdallarchaeota archaeon]